MYHQLEPILNQHGYRSVALNISGLYVNLRKVGETGYSVITIDETRGRFLDSLQFRNISQQIRDYLIQQNCIHNQFLYLLITPDSSSGKRLFSSYDCYWLIDSSTNRFMVFEESDPSFQPLRAPIENLLAQPSLPSRRAKKQPDSFSFQTCSVNYSIIAVNVIIFFLTDFLFLSQNSQLMEKGYLFWPYVIHDHQYYRLITCMFLHYGIDHIFNNMLILLVIGNRIEQRVGHLRYLFLYISSGILAGVTSMVYNMMQNNNSASAGASGAIFGTMGAMLCIVLFKRGKEEYSLQQMLVMVFLSLYGGFTSQGVDNAAHVGGFIGGFLITALICHKERRE